MHSLPSDVLHSADPRDVCLLPTGIRRQDLPAAACCRAGARNSTPSIHVNVAPQKKRRSVGNGEEISTATASELLQVAAPTEAPKSAALPPADEKLVESDKGDVSCFSALTCLQPLTVQCPCAREGSLLVVLGCREIAARSMSWPAMRVKVTVVDGVDGGNFRVSSCGDPQAPAAASAAPAALAMTSGAPSEPAQTASKKNRNRKRKKKNGAK